MKFLDKDNKEKYVYQTSWGASTRLIGAIIMVHGDDNGLVLPPRVAPIQVRIIPIRQNVEGVLLKAHEIKEQLKSKGIRVDIDESDKSPGYKFSEAEVRGIPIRIEIGPNDIRNNKCIIAKRNDYQKIETVLDESLSDVVIDLLNTIHNEMYEKASKYLNEHTTRVKNYDEFKDVLENKTGFVNAPWCGKTECELKIKEDTTATTRCISDDVVFDNDKCICCGEDAKHIVNFAKSY